MGKRASAQSGKFVGAYAPYGYMKDPTNRHKLIIDQNTAPIVRKIFEMRAAGAGHRAIAAKLNRDMITPPREYFKRTQKAATPLPAAKRGSEAGIDSPRSGGGLGAAPPFKWNENTIRDMLKNEAYIGNTISGKTGSLSYKNQKQIRKEQSDWIRAEATHEPIIDPALWEKINSLTKKRYKPTRSTSENLFAGLLYCTTCGFKLRSQTERRVRKDGSQYVSYICSTYARNGKTACTIHGISEKALVTLVADHVSARIQSVNYDQVRISDAVRTARAGVSYRTSCQNEVKAREKQLARLDLLIENLYMDKVTGLVPDSLFKRQVKKFEAERAELAQAINKTRKTNPPALPVVQQQEVDAETLRLLVDKIIVGEAVYADGQKICDVKVVYRFESSTMTK